MTLSRQFSTGSSPVRFAVGGLTFASLFIVPAFQALGANAAKTITIVPLAEYASSDYETTFRGGTLRLDGKSTWLIVMRQQKGTLFEDTDKEIRLWRLNSDGEQTADVPLVTRAAGSGIQADSLFPIPISSTEHHGVILVVGDDTQLYLKVFSPDAKQLHNSDLDDFPELEQFGRAPLSIRSLSQGSALLVTPQMLGIVTYDGRRRAVMRPDVNEVFLDALPVDADRVVAMGAVVGEARNRDATHGLITLRLLSSTDLSLVRSSVLTSQPVSLLSAKMAPLVDTGVAVVTESSGVGDTGNSTWQIHVLDKDANITDSRALASVSAPVPAGPATVHFASIGRQDDNYYIVGTLDQVEQALWIGLFDRVGISIEQFSIIGKTEELLGTTSFDLLPNRDEHTVIIPMTVVSCTMDCRRAQSGIRVMRLKMTRAVQ